MLRILAELEGSGAGFALLHGDGDGPPDIASDVDLAFAQPPPLVIEPILQRLAREGELAIVQRLHYDVVHCYYYILWIPGPTARFLHLDCLCDPLGVNRYRFPTQYLLEGAAPGSYVRRIDQCKEAVYLLMKRAVKGRIAATALDVLRIRFRDASDALWADVRQWFGRKAKRDVEALLRTENPRDAGVPLKALAAGANRVARWRHPLRTARSFLIQSSRKWRRFLEPTGLFVVIVGPDGSGKSTVTGMVLSQLERAFRKTWRFHWRPGLLPKLGRRASASDVQGAASPPAEVSKYRGVVSLARFVYYWLDFILGYWLVIYPRRAQTTLVIAERYFPDVVVHPERYGFSVPRWLLRFAAATVPSPDLLVILRGDPQAIFARKGELSPGKIASQMRLYEEEAHYWRRSEIVDTHSGASAVSARLADLILDACAARVTARGERSRAARQWRAFPAARGVKVWFADAEKLRSSLDLYHAYSPWGRLAKFVSGMAPRALHRLLFRGHPDAATAARFMRLTEMIRTQLKDDTLSVSFSAGTPGPHRKLTAQVTRCGEIISYVKIAQDESVAALLLHEADMLGWLYGQRFASKSLPQILAIAHDGPFTLLFLSPPDQPARQGPPQPGVPDACFLSDLASLSVSRALVAEVFDQKGFDTYLELVHAYDPGSAAMLRRALEAVNDCFQEEGVSATPCHGDYGPWNTLALADGSLFVIDWEYGQRRAPALTDLFHRVLMPACYVLGFAPERVVEELLSLPTNAAFNPVIAQSGVSAHEVPAYVLLYLLGQLVGGRHGRHEDKFMLEMIEHALQSVGELQPRKKILVMAYACEPGHGSEPGVGWRMCEVISRENEVWVITRRNNRQGIEQALAQHPNPHLHFSYADLPPWARFWKKGERGIRLYYYLWQFAALRTALQLARTVKFDLAHHITFVNDYFFTALALQRIPFVWGPIGSPGKRPEALWNNPVRLLWERREHYLKVCMRAADPFFWLSAIRARLVIGIDAEVGRTFPLHILARHKYISHTAIGVEEQLMAKPPRAGRPNDAFQVLSMGRLTRIKGFDLTIRAFALFAQCDPSARLKIVGDGPLRQSLEDLARDLGVVQRVDFVGHVPRSAAMTLMGEADVFLFPTCEAEGMVVLEALAQGLPVACLAYGGPSKMVTAECGFVVEVGPRSAETLAAALEKLASDRVLLQRMGDAARRRVVENYLWEHRHEAVRHWYHAAGIAVPQLRSAVKSPMQTCLDTRDRAG